MSVIVKRHPRYILGFPMWMWLLGRAYRVLMLVAGNIII